MIVKTGVVIGIACAAWTYVMGFAGWYADPVLMNLFWVVVAIEVGLLVVGLCRSAGSNRYWAQVGAGTMMAAIAAVILFVSSLLFTTVVFPDYFSEIREAYSQMARASGRTEAEIADELTRMAATQTPLMQATFGFVGTVVTGFAASLVIGAFCRRK